MSYDGKGETTRRVSAAALASLAAEMREFERVFGFYPSFEDPRLDDHGVPVADSIGDIEPDEIINVAMWTMRRAARRWRAREQAPGEGDEPLRSPDGG